MLEVEVKKPQGEEGWKGSWAERWGGKVRRGFGGGAEDGEEVLMRRTGRFVSQRIVLRESKRTYWCSRCYRSVISTRCRREGGDEERSRKRRRR
jgi:hypothetical protein